MAAYVIDSQLFRDQFGTARMREIFSDEATVQRWLDVESSLAKVQATLGIIPQDKADEIIAKAHIRNIDLDKLKKEMDRTSHPIVPLLRAMKDVCEGDAGEFIHWGATTQDITDTGTILQVADALVELEASYQEIINNLCGLATKYRDVVMVARSHGQHALPITFGFKVAVWVEEMRRNMARFHQMKERVLVGQFSGAVGTLAALEEEGVAVQEALFRDLGLGCPKITWHVSRDNIAELVSVISIITSTIGKIASEVYALQKTEVSELEEPFATGKVGSSTMPHKRNPPSCETIMAIARVVRSTVPLALESVMAEHERDKVVLQTEREFISRVFCMADAAALKMSAISKNLSVRTENMERNLHIQKGLLMSEPVMMRLGAVIGRQEAHEIIYELCMEAFETGESLKSALLRTPAVSERLSEQEIDSMLDPHTYTGASGYFVDKVTAVS